MNYEIKRNLLDVVKRAYSSSLFAGTSGNLSVYDKEKNRILITPGSFSYEAMTEEDLVTINLNGEVKEGKHKPSSEWRMHAEIYRQKPEVHAIIHTHSPFATAFAVNHTPIPVILIEMIPFLGGEVQVADFAIPGTIDVGRHCIKVLKERYACLMANHGVLAIGEDLEEAYLRAVYVEDSAKICTYARMNGEPVILEQKYIDAMKG